MLNKGDFHIHSTASDGNCTPREIVTMAKERHIDIISLTDHNTTNGLDEAIHRGKEIGVKIIPGVELSTRYNNTRVHVLGYFKDESYKNELLVQILHLVKTRKINKVKKLLQGYLTPYYRREALCVENGIELLRFFGATVVLAHPVLIPRGDFKQIIKMNFDGIEAKYFKNTEDDTDYFLNISKARNLFYTAGSDSHLIKEIYRVHGLIGDAYLNAEEINDFLIRGKLTKWL